MLPSGSTRTYRGTVALVKRDSRGRTVNTVSLEDYVKGVVASEMPTSWAANAVRSQAVAARSYAVRIRDFTDYSGYDLCDTTVCQVYGGVGAETAAGNAAVVATAGSVVTYQGKVALTQFASSNGGHTAQGDYRYLAPKADPYDGVVTSQAWTRTISAAQHRQGLAVGRAPSRSSRSPRATGPVRGEAGSRRSRSSAASGSVSVSGGTFQYRFGMRSSLFTVGGSASAPAPAPAPGPIAPGKAYASFPRSYHSASAADLLLIAADGRLRRYPLSADGLGAPTTVASGASGYTHVVNAGDWNGDGYQDVIVRSTAEKLYLKRGGGAGTLAAGVAMGFGANIAAMTAIGDADGDGKPDLAVITDAGNLWIYYGDGKTGRKARALVSAGWGGQEWLRAPGDFDGDGRPDLITKAGDRLLLHRGVAGGFAEPVTLATGWSGIATIAALGDVDADGKADVVARTTAGRLVVYRGDGHASLSRAETLTGSFTGTRFAL